MILSIGLEFTNLILRLTKIVAVLQDILIINVAVLIISLFESRDYWTGFNNNQCSIEDLLWEKEKYWQAQLFTNLCGMNNVNDLYSMKKKGYRK